MAAVISTPIKAWLASLYTGGFVSHGQAFTVTFHMTQGWEAQIPIGVRYGTNVSLAAAVNVYPSNDGGTTFDTAPLIAFPVQTRASNAQVTSIRLTTGQYALAVFISSPSCTVFVLTQEVVTAVNNV